MLPIDRNKDIIEQINRILRRIDHLQQTKSTFFSYLLALSNLYSNFSQSVFKQISVFQDKIAKSSFYSTTKSAFILNLAKIFRQFTVQMERTSKINLLNLQRIKHVEITKQQQKLKGKCSFFLKQFTQYVSSQQAFNSQYNSYSQQCKKLDDIIMKFQSYSDPLLFYNQTLTHEYLKQLQKNYNSSSSAETAIRSDVQVLDQKRKWLSQNIKQVNQSYVFLLHNHLVVIQNAVGCVVDPTKSDLEIGNLNSNRVGILRNSDDEWDGIGQRQIRRMDDMYKEEVERENNGDVFSDFSQLFKKSINSNEISSDYKFFYDRIDTIRSKKVKNISETLHLQTSMIEELSAQRRNCLTFENQCKQIQKQVFKNNGIQSYRKKFRKYFGLNVYETQQLCLAIIERPRRSLQKIGKSKEDNALKLKRIIDLKIQSKTTFQRRSKTILQDHLKIKQKIESKQTVDGEIFQKFRTNVASSFTEFKKIFMELETNQKQFDAMFFKELKIHFDVITKEITTRNLSKMLEKQKTRVQIFRSLNIDSQIIQILKEDSRYENLLNECPKPNLYQTFISKIKQKQYEQTRIILQKKQSRLKMMLKQKMGCCGMKSEPIRHNVLAVHPCKLLSNKSKINGGLSILSVGVTFQEKSFNPFANLLQLMIPQSDILSFDTKAIENEGECVEMSTDMGPLIFLAENPHEIIGSIEKNITFKIKDYPSQKDKKQKRNDSSSFIKNNTSTQFRLSYDKDKSILNASNENKLNKAKASNNTSKNASDNGLLKDLERKWRQPIFFSQSFAPILKKKAQNRMDYSYKNGHSKFLLKQKKQSKMVSPTILVFDYLWKISFPQTPILHSFIHKQTVRIQVMSKELVRVTVTQGKYSQEQLFIKSKFYRQVEEMNKKLCDFILNVTERQVQVLIEQESDDNKSVDSYNIMIEEANVEKEDLKFQKTGESFMRSSKLERGKSNQFSNSNNSTSNIPNQNSNAFK